MPRASGSERPARPAFSREETAMDTVGCKRPRQETSSLTVRPRSLSAVSARAMSTMSAEDTVALAHSSMMSDILRGVQRHRGMPAVMLRQTPVTMRLTSLTPASVREQQMLLRSVRPMRRSMRPSSERCPALCVMVGLSTPWCSAISEVRSGLPTFARWHMMPSSSNVTRPEAGVDWRTRPKARRTDRYSHTFNDKTPEKQRTSSSLGYP